MKLTPCIYRIRNRVNDKVYIGSTVAFTHRRTGHLKALQAKRHHSIVLQRAWNKYGAESFDFEIIEFVEDREFLLAREQSWINQTKSFLRKHGYNICQYVHGPLGVKRSKSFCENLSRMHKGNTYSLGKPCSQETRELIAQSKRGKSLSTAHKLKMSAIFSGKGNPSYGRKKTDEEKCRISQGVKNHWAKGGYLHRPRPTEDTKRKISSGIISAYIKRKLSKQVPEP